MEPCPSCASFRGHGAGGTVAGAAGGDICQETGQYLANLADLATPEAFLFIAFRVPYSPAIGIKLISTPWTD